MSPEEMNSLEALQYTRATLRVAAASLSPDAQVAFVASFDRLTSAQVGLMLSSAVPSEKDIARAGGGVWSAAKDFVGGILGSNPSSAKVEEIAEHLAGRQLTADQIEAIRSGIAAKGPEATTSWVTQLIMRVIAGRVINALPVGSPQLVP